MKLNLLTIAVATLILNGCDTFHRVNAVVLDTNSGLVVCDAYAKLVLDKGFGESDQETTSKLDGTVNFLLNEPSGAWTTLTIQKDGYETWTQQFQGSPKEGLKINLIPNTLEVEK